MTGVAPLLADFRPRAPWWGPDLQTLRNYIVRDFADLSRWPAEELVFPMANGDRLSGVLHRPAEPAARPTVVLIHGFTGCADSIYILASARQLLRAGYPIIRLNLRGAPPIRQQCRELYHAGRSEDFRAAIAQLPERMTADGLVAIGYSLGGNMLLKYLGEEGSAAPLRAAISVSAPIDLAAATRRMSAARNCLYHRWLVARSKRDWLAGPSTLDAALRRAVKRAPTLYQLDDTVVGPLNGFAGADDYYRRCAAQSRLAAIAVPTLIVHAADDPWIPVAMYRRVDWAANDNLVPAIAPAGGHVGFHGRGGRWHDRVIGAFLQRL